MRCLPQNYSVPPSGLFGSFLIVIYPVGTGSKDPISPRRCSVPLAYPATHPGPPFPGIRKRIIFIRLHLAAILHVGFCCRIKTPRWLELHWNLYTDYFGFTWFGLNVKATQLLRGKELAWALGNHNSQPLKSCFVLLPSILTQPEAVQIWPFLENLSPQDIFRLPFVSSSQPWHKLQPLQARTAKFHIQGCICHLNKGNGYNFPTALNFPEILCIE